VIRVKGDLANRWSDWFEGLEIRSDPDGGTTLKGQLVDQAALFSVLTRINNLEFDFDFRGPLFLRRISSAVTKRSPPGLAGFIFSPSP